MKQAPSLSILRGLLFVFDVDNVACPVREDVIASKNVACESELVELFDAIMRPHFFLYNASDRQWLIESIGYFLAVANENFDSVFNEMTTYFDEDIQDRRTFMRVLLGCLLRYQVEVDTAR